MHIAAHVPARTRRRIIMYKTEIEIKLTQGRLQLSSILTYSVHAAGEFRYFSLLARWTRLLVRVTGDLSDEVHGDTVEDRPTSP